MPLGREVYFGPSDIVLDGDPAPTPQRVTQQPPNFQPMYCGQRAEWIKISVGTEVGLGPGHIVLDGNPAPPNGTQVPNFRPMYIIMWPNGWIDQDATWYGGRPRPRPHCVRCGPSFSPKSGGTARNFRPMSVRCGQTVAHLSCC